MKFFFNNSTMRGRAEAYSLNKGFDLARLFYTRVTDNMLNCQFTILIIFICTFHVYTLDLLLMPLQNKYFIHNFKKQVTYLLV